jgi:hypothetical protein
MVLVEDTELNGEEAEAEEDDSKTKMEPTQVPDSISASRKSAGDTVQDGPPKENEMLAVVSHAVDRGQPPKQKCL